ncbi:unnamed protein product [Calypogeia fissa]
MAGPVYRGLLKALKTHVTKVSGNPHFREFVAAEFRKHKDLSDPAAIQQKLNLAKDYTTLVNSVHHHKELLLSYNIGVDRVAEQKARLIDTAHRVGLEMPDLYKDTGSSK